MKREPTPVCNALLFAGTGEPFQYTPARRAYIIEWAARLGWQRTDEGEGWVRLVGPGIEGELWDDAEVIDVRLLAEMLSVAVDDDCAVERLAQPLEYPWSNPRRFEQALLKRAVQ